MAVSGMHMMHIGEQPGPAHYEQSGHAATGGRKGGFDLRFRLMAILRIHCPTAVRTLIERPLKPIRAAH
jgi:hypothetical protein